jgi:hypothetical protein
MINNGFISPEHPSQKETNIFKKIKERKKKKKDKKIIPELDKPIKW